MSELRAFGFFLIGSGIFGFVCAVVFAYFNGLALSTLEFFGAPAFDAELDAPEFPDILGADSVIISALGSLIVYLTRGPSAKGARL